MLKKIKNGRNIEALEFYFEPQLLSTIDKDLEQNKRNLTTIANDIKRKDMLKEIKIKNPITGKIVNKFDTYLVCLVLCELVPHPLCKK